MRFDEVLRSDSFLEYAFLRWVLSPVAKPDLVPFCTAQSVIKSRDRTYRADYEIQGVEKCFVIELDGFAHHGSREAFTYDRIRQNDLLAEGKQVLRFTYDSIRLHTETCGRQLIAALSIDPRLRTLLQAHPVFERPQMESDPMAALKPSPSLARPTFNNPYFASIYGRLDCSPLRDCQREAYASLAGYFSEGGKRAACVMSVGAGKTVLGVLSSLAFTKRRALVITPGTVIRGTFDRAFDHEAVGNALYGLPGGPLTPGCPPPKVLTLERESGAISGITRDQLLSADVILTNFHSLGDADSRDGLLSKLLPEDIDFIVIDEAHIAAADSYIRALEYFKGARALLMSACFQRLDGKPIDADVVYRYRLIDSIADGHAKTPSFHRFEPEVSETIYQFTWPSGTVEEIRGRDALLELLANPRKLAHITAKSTESIRSIVRTVRNRLTLQEATLNPIRPRALFSALGERHAQQIAQVAEEEGIPCSYLHHSMSDARIRSVRERFESESGDLSAIVQLKMLGQGYDFPPICVVSPMRPYGSFSEFYQFVGRGIRVVKLPSSRSESCAKDQSLDVVFHTEMGLDDHIDTLCLENDMDPKSMQQQLELETQGLMGMSDSNESQIASEGATVLFERGTIVERMIHGSDRVEGHRLERLGQAYAQRYSAYVQTTPNPVSFEQFQEIINALGK